MERAHRQARTAGVLLGLGMGGLVDDIALHQIVQWHNMLSARLPPTPLEAMWTNMTADGWFHAAVWVLALTGGVLLYRATRSGRPLPPTRWFVGLLVAGWVLFNLVEGLIDHHLLELHPVHDLPEHVPAYGYAFLAVGGLGFLALGWWLARSAREPAR